MCKDMSDCLVNEKLRCQNPASANRPINIKFLKLIFLKITYNPTLNGINS